MFVVRHTVPAETAHASPDVVTYYEAERLTFHPCQSNQGALELRSGDTFVAGLWGGQADILVGGQVVDTVALPPRASDTFWQPEVEWARMGPVGLNPLPGGITYSEALS